MRSSIAALLLIASATGVADDVVPVHEEPFHRLAVDDPGYRVLDVSIPPGKITLFHTHAEPTLYVTLQRTRVRSQRLDGEWGPPNAADWAPGDVRYDGAALDEPFTHRVENLGDDDFRLTLITNNRRTSTAHPGLPDAVPGAPGLDNAYFAQSRIDLQPGETYRFEGASLPLILVLASGAQVAIHGPDSAPRSQLGHPGDIASIRDVAGSLSNQGDAPATIIAVAIR